MNFSRRELKLRSKRLLKENGPSVYTAAAVYIAVIYIFDALISRLSGFSRYMSDYFTMFDSEYLKLFDGAAGLSQAELTERYINMLDKLITAVHWPETAAVALVLCAAICAMRFVLSAGYLGYCLMVSRGMKPKTKNVFDGFYFTGKVIVINLLRGVIVGVGFILLIVPGVIFLYRYRMAIFVMLDNPDKGAIWCLRRSGKIMKGRKMDLFVLDVSFVGWLILAAAISSVFLPVLDLWIQPYTGVAYAGFYNGLKKPEGSEETEEH